MQAGQLCAAVLAVSFALAGHAASAATGVSKTFGAETPTIWDGKDPDTVPKYLKPVTKSNYLEVLRGPVEEVCGYRIELPEGGYDIPVTVGQKCGKDKPMVITSAMPFKAKFTKTLTVAASAQYVVVTRLMFEGATAGIRLDGTRVRATRNIAVGNADRAGIEAGTSARYVMIDRNLVENYRLQGISLDTDPAPAAPKHVLIQRNWVRHRLVAPERADPNLEEAIQIGQTGSDSANEIHAVVELNVVDDNKYADDPISIKSSRNTVRHNVVTNVAAAGIVLRNGQANLVWGNIVDKSINVTGNDHMVVGNQAKTINMIAGTLPDGDLTKKIPIDGCPSKTAAWKVSLAANKAAVKIGVLSRGSCPNTIANYKVHDILIERNTGACSVTASLATDYSCSNRTTINVPTLPAFSARSLYGKTETQLRDLVGPYAKN